MSIARFGPSNYACVKLMVACVRSYRSKKAFRIFEVMKKFKFKPTFSTYTTLIDALSTRHDSKLMLTLFHQMQELGYKVNVHLFTTLV